jgi:SAM-dependent methyltransferase
MTARNIDEKTVASFGDEWTRYDQTGLDDQELNGIFQQYFGIFPWDRLPAQARGFDMGCGSGRWARFVSPRVGHLTCIDASADALNVARRNLAGATNVSFAQSTANEAPLEPCSQDFGYSLGVLHHIPDTASAMRACTALLKPGAPFLVYLYYRFDNRPAWYAALWRASEFARGAISSMPPRLKHLTTDIVAATVYWPLARMAWLGDNLGLPVKNLPLYAYRNYSFYTMRTDSRDRFGTPLEQRFKRAEITAMMESAGLGDVRFSDVEPFWCAVGVKRA